jgi:hypothetical protein
MKSSLNYARVGVVIFLLLFWLGIIQLLTSKLTLRYQPPTPKKVLIGGNTEMTVMRLDNFVLGAFVDGTLCYGTHEPRKTECKRAVPRPEMP